MPFKRALLSTAVVEPAALTSALVGIGMKFAADASPDPNVEDTLLAASNEGMEGEALRVLALLATWFEIHYPWINVDRLTHLVAAHPSPRVRALWAALARWKAADRRFLRLGKLHVAPRLDLLAVGSSFHLRQRGEDPRFAGGPLRVPGGILRDRVADVETPAELSRHHRAYRYRVMIGPTYRADMWAAIENDPTLSAAALARKTYGSFATAWRVRKDFMVIGAEGA